MMDMKRLLGIRPKSETAEAIQTSIASAEAARDAALAEITRIEASRPGLLANGTEAEIITAEAKLVAARTDAEQMAALAAGLAPRLTAAKHAEQLVEIRALTNAAETASNRFADFMMGEYRQLAERLGAGMRLELAALQINERLHEAMNTAPAAAAEAGLTRAPMNPAVTLYPGAFGAETMQIAYHVRLPAPPGNEGPGDGGDWGWLKPLPGRP